MDRVIKNKFLETIQSHALIKKGDRIVLGVSGGPDSMCMLHLFCSIREEWSLSLYAVHLNHQFRGEASDSDALYVEEKCREWSVPLYSFSSNVEEVASTLKTSFEDAGRKERYRLFFEVLNEVQANKIAVAQNRNDQAETVLMRLIRGSGLEGLTGIDYSRKDGVIRPVLDLTREEIEDYCESNGLLPRRDHTNDDVQYTRNKIRKNILTQMQSINPSVVDNIVNTRHLLEDEQELLRSVTNKAYVEMVEISGDGSAILLEPFNKQPVGLKRRLIRKCIEEIRGHLTDVTYDEVEAVIQLATRKRTGSKKNYHGNLTFEISYDKLFVYLGKREIRKDDFTLKVREMTREEFDDYRLLADEIAVDKGKLTGALVIKSRQPGDKFNPTGLRGQKKLKDFFIDKKIPRDERNNIPLVWDDAGIVWIVGYRQDRRYVVDDNTSKVLILQCMKLLTQ